LPRVMRMVVKNHSIRRKIAVETRMRSSGVGLIIIQAYIERKV